MSLKASAPLTKIGCIKKTINEINGNMKITIIECVCSFFNPSSLSKSEKIKPKSKPKMNINENENVFIKSHS